jgi:fumarate hydratase class II
MTTSICHSPLMTHSQQLWIDENKTLREAAIETGYISAEEFDKIVIPENMIGNPYKDLDV